jgi:Ni2+-binding GTPase involved in maturation of urease and hydrogenase
VIPCAGSVRKDASACSFLRENSGSGKTTVATAIRHARDRRELAVVPQDVVRRQI